MRVTCAHTFVNLCNDTHPVGKKATLGLHILLLETWCRLSFYRALKLKESCESLHGIKVSEVHILIAD